MSITVRVPLPLRSCCGGEAQLSIESAVNLRDLLEELERSFPVLYQSICLETGSLRPHVNLFVNSSLVRDKETLDTAITSGDVIAIFQAVSGG